MPQLPSRLALFPVSRLSAAFFALLLFAGSGLRASETVIVGQPRNADDPAAIRALEDESRRAVLARDYATLERIWSERFVVNAPNDKVYPNRAAVFDVFRRSNADLYESYEKNIECIAFDEDLAIVMGVETVTPFGQGVAKKAAQRRYTSVWRFTKGTWLLIARQATMIVSNASAGGLATPKP